ncbi:MAG: hypothetical protein RL291_1438 [Pseudomonadota bacterium]
MTATSTHTAAPRLPPAPITFRRATDADRVHVEALQAAAYARNRALLGVEPAPLVADYSHVFATMEIWLAEERDRLRGVLILELEPDAVHIWSLAAAPDAQKQGLGPILLDAAEIRAAQLGRDRIRLCTGAKLSSLVAWYQRHGYAIERTEVLHDRTITHMAKPVPPHHD